MAQYYKLDSTGEPIPAEERGIRSLTEDITAAKTLVISDSGKTFSLNAAAGVAVALPGVSIAGFKCKIFVKAAFATTDFTIVSATNIIQGGAIVNSVWVPAANENTISFVATAETIGDFITIEGDGVNWYVNGVAAAIGGITFTVV